MKVLLLSLALLVLTVQFDRAQGYQDKPIGKFLFYGELEIGSIKNNCVKMLEFKEHLKKIDR